MAVVPQANASDVFDLKSAALTLVALQLKTTDLSLLESELERRFGDAPALFDQDPVAIDLSALRDEPDPIDFSALIALLRRHKMVPVAARGGSAAQMEAARAAGLTDAQERTPPRVDNVVLQEVITEVIREVQVPTPMHPTVVVDKPLRSGQQVYAKGADLVVLAVVSFGAEVIADGHIHVYAPLRGRAIAGARGNTDARIFTTCMEPQLVSIAGIYRTTETELPADVLGQPAQVRLDGERLVVEPLKS
ncbi:MAG TPA: septum site-determining protein MinC [Albitalea sp.]|nr:septum site-determining protein MinC [Albitalea sp.]